LNLIDIQEISVYGILCAASTLLYLAEFEVLTAEIILSGMERRSFFALNANELTVLPADKAM
jgi:hypothetical protein